MPRRAAPVAPLPTAPPLAELAVEEWTPRLLEFHRAQQWDQLRAELETLRERHPRRFEQSALGYLLARLLIELRELDEAERELAPFLVPGHLFAPLARHHEIEIQIARGNTAEAARLRQMLILDERGSPWRDEEIEQQIEVLEDDPQGMLRFVERLRPNAAEGLRRELDARAAEAWLELDQEAKAVDLALSLLRGSTSDDAAERALGIVDRPAVLARLSPEAIAMAGEAARSHRHFDRAVELLELARERLPQREADLLFAAGRSWFGDEEFQRAEEAYLSGAAVARGAEQKALFYFHASRAAQLQGEDDRAVRHMTRAIAVPGQFGSTSAALTQRMRTRLKEGNLDAGLSDLRLLERLFPRGGSRTEASTQLATYFFAAGREETARRELQRIPSRLVGAWERPEIDYWLARTWEGSNPELALEFHLDVLRADVPTHFAYFSRERIRTPYLEETRSRRLSTARDQAEEAMAAGRWDEARRLATVAALLDGGDDDLRRLERIYREIPSYREVLELEAEALPRFPLPASAARGDLLMAMGLFDEATERITERWGLKPMRSAFTRAHALNLAAASRDSIYAIEVMMRSVPDDFVPQVLPMRVRELLYPRYYLELIDEHADRYGADPRLVLSIMREESRFNPRAKSAAAARGLLQFIITTALDISQSLGLADLESSDLYDPATIIRLGARYVADLLEEFEGNPYPAAAAYNAGPYQTRLWARLQAAEGSDYFLSGINFSETKHYVRKVMNSHQRYGEIYEGIPPVGGTRAEP